MLSFMETLSPAQRIAFEAMTTTAVPMAVEPAPSPPPGARVFYNTDKKGRATEAEVLVLTTLLALSPIDLDKCVNAVDDPIDDYTKRKITEKRDQMRPKVAAVFSGAGPLVF